MADLNGKILTQFTQYAIEEHGPVLSPDGREVAYLAGGGDTDTYSFTVVDKYGRQGTFSVRPSSRHGAKNDNTVSLGANNSIEALSWNSSDILRVTKWAGKDVARFEFYRIPHNLSHPAHEASVPVLEQNCVAKHDDGSVACIEREGDVILNDRSGRESDVFSISGFEGVAPEESFTVHVGDSVTPPNGPPFTIGVKSIVNNQITLRLTPADTGIWGEMQIDNGSYMPGVDHRTGDVYGFFATIVNANTGLVRIDLAKSSSPTNVFDPALSWQPNGPGLLFIRRTNNQAMLYLIKPGRDDQRQHMHEKYAKDPQWRLVAQTPINISAAIAAMHFATPSLLLLKTVDGQFSEVSINIQHGGDQDDGKPALALGTITPLPTTLKVTIKGATTVGEVLGWSCEADHGDGDDD
ncbi:MAG: hypothetical protein ACRESU_00115 [Gammaproteobacteria bacterium]